MGDVFTSGKSIGCEVEADTLVPERPHSALRRRVRGQRAFQAGPVGDKAAEFKRG